MNVLLVNPDSPRNVGPTDPSMRIAGKRAYQPPLGLITVAAILPQSWRFKLADLTYLTITEADWEWADLVIISGTIVQKAHILEIVRESKRRDKLVSVGGPGMFHLGDEALAAGADFVVKGEGEVTVPLLLDRMSAGERGVTIESAERADMTTSPTPRYDLLDLDAYVDVTMQFSRGCPFRCDFCDVTRIFGRALRTKTADQVLQELQTLYDLGWRRQVWFVDDNFVGNPSRANAFLKRLIQWMDERGRPFEFYTYASVNLGKLTDSLDLMVRAGFARVYLGIETTDKETLKSAGKLQNAAVDLDEVCRTINTAGLQIIALTMLGFDNEQPCRDRRVIDFAQRNAIPEVDVSLVHALPETRLWNRLKHEDRLVETDDRNLGDWHELVMNFLPTRPISQILGEYVRIHETLYEPKEYLERSFQHFARMDPPPIKIKPKFPDLFELRVLALTIFKRGIAAESRWTFWKLFFRGLRTLTRERFAHFIRSCVTLEHYLELTARLKAQLERREKGGNLDARSSNTIGIASSLRSLQRHQ